MIGIYYCKNCGNEVVTRAKRICWEEKLCWNCHRRQKLQDNHSQQDVSQISKSLRKPADAHQGKETK